MTKFGVGAHKPYTTIGPLSREQALHLVKADWYYDWSVSPIVYPGVESVPMVWGRSDVGRAIGGNSEWLLTFNEPDSTSQANMSLTECAQQFRKLEDLHPTRRLVSPAPTADNWGWRDQWLAEYRRLYGKLPRVDAVATHIYPRTWGYFVEAMDAAWRFAQQFGVRVWVTEYAFLPCWPASDIDIGRMTQYLMNNPARFERWAPFILTATGSEPWNFGTNCNTSLVSKSTGKLTSIGETYASLHPPDVDYADPRADVNKDGAVDILDMVIVGGSFGKAVKP